MTIAFTGKIYIQLKLAILTYNIVLNGIVGKYKQKLIDRHY
jgi:hypothetical protein